MPRHPLLGLICLMSLKCVKCDILLNNFRSELGNYSQNMPKVWLSYIQMHLFKQLDKYEKMYQYGNNTASVGDMLWKIFSGTKLFLFLNSNATLTYKCPLWEDASTNMGYLNCHIEHTIGHFMFQPRNPGEKRMDISVYWRLHPRLSLNLTFFTIYFSFCMSNCVNNFGQILDLAISDGYEACIYDTWEGPTYLFCGQYSTFSLFSKDNYLELCKHSNRYGSIDSEYKVVGMFMTIDRNLLFNEPTLQMHTYVPILKKAMKPQFVYYIKKKYKLLRFFITVDILNKVKLAMNDFKIHRYVVFDGPDLLSDNISKRKANKFIITSTFQCLILLLKTDNTEDSLNFSSQKIPVYSQIYIRHNNKSIFHYPNEECNENFCISLFHTEKGKQINITIISLKSEISTQNYNCLNAGLYAGEGLVSQFIEGRIVPGSNDSQAISFYSHNSSMILFLYWYSGISKIDASVMISLTKCKPVLINPCYLFQYGRRCNYMNDLVNFSDIDLTIYIDLTKSDIEYTLKEVRCSIILISNVQSLHHRSCKVVLTPRHAVNIQLRYVLYNSDLRIVEQKLEASKKHLTFFNNFSEPTVPRLIPKNIGLLKNETLSSGVHISKDASFAIDIQAYLTKSRIEFLIQRNVANGTNDLNLRRFAMDFPYYKFFDPSKYGVHNFWNAKSVILLKSNTKISDLNLTMHTSFAAYFKWPWSSSFLCSNPYRILLSFSFSFYQLKYGKYFSFLTDSTQDIQLLGSTLQGSHNIGNEPLTLVWIKDNYIRHDRFLEITSEKCFINAKSWLCNKTKVNTIVGYREYYLITERWKPHKYVYYKLKSWNEAANACQLVGGHLPWFESRESLHELLSLLKLSRHFPTTEAIYIGLKHNTREVSQIVFSYCVELNIVININLNISTIIKRPKTLIIKQVVNY